MSQAAAPLNLIPDPSMEGARVCWRHWQTTTPAKEGWLVEFSEDGRSVRIRETQDTCERGVWMRCKDVRITAQLNEHRAPDERRRGGED